MPKTAKNLWPSVTTFENLLAAWKLARRGKRRSLSAVRFWGNLEENLFGIQEQLVNHWWKPSPWREFVVREPKLRLIQAPYFGDRVVHHALMRIAEPVFERRFIDDSFACRKGKGTHAASRRTTDFLRRATTAWGSPYILKADISKFFPSISHTILMHRLDRLFGDPDVMWLFERIVMHNGFNGRGVPIGALTSQWLANLFLDALDHFVKDDLGIKYYLRYMDDFVVVGPNKAWCATALGQIERFVNMCDLRLNPKTAIYPASHGVDFVGYRHWTDHTLPRKRTMKRARRLFKSLVARYNRGEIDLDYVRPRIASFAGYVQHCDAYRSAGSLFDSVILSGSSHRQGASQARG